jgi:hypothetical protein
MNRSVTMIDKELRFAIAQLNDLPRDSDQRDLLLSKIDKLKLKRMQTVRTKTYDRMLTSLG